MKKIRKYVFCLVVLLSKNGCGYAASLNRSQTSSMQFIDVRQNLTGMNSDEVKRYFDQCIKEGKIFIYSGGVTGGPIVRNQADREFIEKLRTVFIDCTKGVEQALQFNELMIAYLKSRK